MHITAPKQYSFIGYHKAAFMTISSSTQAKLQSYKDEFMEIVWEASEALKANFSNVEELAVKVNEILKDDKGEPLVFETLPTSHSQVFPVLQKQWSYTNSEFLYQLIHRILEKHTASRRTSGRHTAKKHTSGKCTVGTTLKKKIESYRQSYRSFCQSLEITNESHIQLEAYDPSKPCLILTIKKGPLQLKDIYSFLENEFDIKNRYLRIHTIEPGSIKVILQFPATMTELFQAYIDQKQEAVKDFVEMKIKPLPPKHTDDGQHTQLELLKRHANDKPIVQPEDRKRHAVTDQLVKYEPTDELFAQPKPPKTRKMNDK